MIAFFFPAFSFRGDTAPYLWVYYKFLTTIDEPGLFIIGGDYNADPERWAAAGRWEVLDATQKANGYELPSPEILSRHKFEIVNEAALDAVHRSAFYNSHAVFKLFLTADIPGYRNEISRIISKYPDIETIVTWVNCPSLEIAASAHGCSVAHIELGPLRAPEYLNTNYFDFTGVNGNSEAERRYIESGRPNFVGLQTEDFLYFFSQNADSSPNASAEEIAAIGVALQVDNDSNLIAFGNGFDCSSIISLALNRAGEVGKVLARPHPGGSFIPRATNRIACDTSPSIASFVKRCETIVTINSSVGFEAMLAGKSVEILGNASFKFILEADTEQERINRMAFYLFAYLVPRPLAFDSRYIRFRIAQPSLAEVLRCHIEGYLMNTFVEPTEEGDPAQIVQEAIIAKQRLELDSLRHVEDALRVSVSEKEELIQELDSLRRVEVALQESVSEKEQLIQELNSLRRVEVALQESVSEKEQLIQELNSLRRVEVALRESVSEKEQQIEVIKNSTSWKITSPMRYLIRFMNRNRF